MKKAQDKIWVSASEQQPHIGHKALYETQGHMKKYGKDSFRSLLLQTPHEGEEFLLKPMNCLINCESTKISHIPYKEFRSATRSLERSTRYEAKR